MDVVSALIPPPFLRDDMEFHFGAWGGSSTILCADGRPLGEDNAYPGFFRRVADTEYRTGTFPDSRNGKCYNMTALHHMMKDWDEIMVLLIELRRKYKDYAGISEEHLSVRQLYLFAKLIVAINPWLVRNSSISVDSGSLSPVLASMTKLITGVFMIVRHMIETGEKEVFYKSVADEEELFKYADQHGLLISPRDKDFACAGSKRKIVQLIEILISGEGAYKAGSDVKGHLELIGDLKKCFQYAVIDLEMELTLQLSVIRIILQAHEHNNGSRSEQIKEHVKERFPPCFSDREKLLGQQQNLSQLMTDLGTELLEIPGHQPGQEFSEHYEMVLHALQEYCMLKQQEINMLLEIPAPEPITLKKVHKRLGVVPGKFKF